MSDDLDEISHCVVRHDEDKQVKSQAIVKHQEVKSVANFARLQCNTDLNVPPSNWLNSSINAYGLQQALSQSTGFSSFLMAHLLPSCVGEVDVVSNAENIKRLLKLPYSPNSTISMVVHRVENTLLIDEFDVHKYLLQQSDDNWPWLRSFIYENILSSLGERDSNFLTPNNNIDATQQRSLLSKFLYHSISRTEEPISTKTSPSREPIDSTLFRPSLQLTGPELPEPNIEDNIPDPEHTTHTYNRNVVWTFEDIRMLIGTDMAIFGGNSRPCISLRLRDMTQPINVLTGIDYWLDNLMCNVPEVVMCYHLDGLVQKYEIIKTEDLPYLENSEFSPKVIRNVAQNILSFLKQNATKSGHTYWLFKGRNDDAVKLYDLTSLCTKDDVCNSEPAAQATTKDDKGRKDPFTVPVAMLLYKVARNMKNSKERITAKQAGSIKALLENCIKLLPKEEYPQIVTSSYYLLSDLYVPTWTDPVSPNFSDTESDICSMYEEDERYNSDCDTSNDEIVGQMTDNVAFKNINELNLDRNWQQSTSPPPITGSVEERCAIALEYVVNGLNCLQYFSSTEEKFSKEKEEIAKQEEKIRIIHEEQNPNMARLHQVIPLPYENLNKLGTKIQPETKSEETLEYTKVAKNKKNKRGRKKLASLKDKLKKSQEENDKTQSLMPKIPTGVVHSWDVHLKLLMLEKVCLVYVILMEEAYKNGQYGLALKYVSLAKKCQQVVTKHASNISIKISLLGRAGDCLFQCSQHFENIEAYIKEFKTEHDFDRALKRELQIDFENLRDITAIPEPIDDIEELNVMAITCYETALNCTPEKTTEVELMIRMGSVLNELGVRYMHQAESEYRKTIRELLDDSASAEVATPSTKIYKALAAKSYSHLLRGITTFETVKDSVNLSIILCNMGRYMRFRSQINNNGSCTLMKKYYYNAFNYYERALGFLESKKKNPGLWELVAWELSTCKYSLSQQLLEFSMDEMPEEIKQEIIELLLGSLKLCDVETVSPKQILFCVRTGIIYQQLGTIYFSAFRGEVHSDVRRKKLLQLCCLYFEKSSKMFEDIDAPTEFISVQNNRIDLQEFLFDDTQNYSKKTNHLQTAFRIFQNSKREIDKIDAANLGNQSDSLDIFLGKLQLILRKSIKHCMDKSVHSVLVPVIKKLYAVTLRVPTDGDYEELCIYLRSILNTLAKINFN